MNVYVPGNISNLHSRSFPATLIPNKNGTVSPSQKELLYFVLQLGELGDSQPFFYFFLILLFMQETETKDVNP